MSEQLPCPQLIDSLLAHSEDALVFLGPDLRIRAASTSFRDLTGVGSGAAFTDTLDPFTAQHAGRTFEGLQGETACTSVVLHHKNAEAASLPYRYTWTACRDEQGACLGFWGVGRPHTALDETSAAELREKLVQLEAERDRRIQELTRLRERVKTQSQVDELTGLGNRRFILDRLETEVPRAIRYNEPLTILLFDIDHMSKVNEEHGQTKGDEVLRRVAAVVQQQVRATDLVARFGGEEFMVLCPHTDRASSTFLAERLRRRVAEMSFVGKDDEEFGVTISTGMVTVAAGNEFDVEAILQAAQDALQAAKDGGMNRVQLVEAP